MKIDPLKERYHITEIRADLSALLSRMGVQEQDIYEYPGATAMLAACSEFERITGSGNPFPVFFHAPQVRRTVYHAMGALDLVRNVKSLTKSKFSIFEPHIRNALYAGFGMVPTYCHLQDHCDKLFALALDQRKQGKRLLTPTVLKDIARKNLELAFGLAGLAAFDDVELENPDHSSEAEPNPDIIVTHEGTKFGVACKTVTSRHVSNFRERIEEGLWQIDRAVRSGRVANKCGVVLLDISPLLDHDKLYMPDELHIWSDDTKAEIMRYSMQAVTAEVFGVSVETKFSDLMGDILMRYSAAPCVMVHAHTIMISNKTENGAPCMMKDVHLIFGNDHSSVKTFATRLNDALHAQVRSSI